MKLIIPFVTILILSAGCMKSKDEYRQAIDDVQEQQYNDAIKAQKQEEEERQEQEEARARGSNDAEGMGMDE